MNNTIDPNYNYQNSLTTYNGNSQSMLQDFLWLNYCVAARRRISSAESHWGEIQRSPAEEDCQILLGLKHLIVLFQRFDRVRTPIFYIPLLYL